MLAARAARCSTPTARPRAHPARARGARRHPGRASSSARRSGRRSGRVLAGQLGRGVLSSMDRVRRRVPRGGPGDPHRVARGRAAGRRARSRRSAAPRRSRWSCAASTSSCRRRPRSSARSPARSTPRGCPTCSSASTPCRCRRSTRRRTRRPPGSRRRRSSSTARDHDPGVRHARSTAPACSSRPATSSPTPTSSPARRRSGPRIGSDVADAVPVLFDPNLDVAVLYAPDLDGPSLRFATTVPERGRRGRGPRATRVAGRSWCCRPRSRARTRPPATTSTTRAQVTREIVELRAAIEPGDSGGPLILEDGTIGGLVFAESRDGPGGGLRPEPDRGRDARGAGDRPDGRGRRGAVPRLTPGPTVPAGAGTRRGDTDSPDGPSIALDPMAAGPTPPPTLDRRRRRATGTPTSRRTRCSRPRSATRASTTASRTPRPRARPRPGRGTRRSSTGSTELDAAAPRRRRPDHACRRCASRSASDIAQLDTGLLDWNIDPLEGVPANFLLVPDYQRLETAGGRAPDGRPLAGDGRLHGPRTSTACAGASPTGRVACVAPGERTVRILEDLLDGDDRGLAAPRAARTSTSPSSGLARRRERERFAAELTRGRRRRDPARRSSGSTTRSSPRSCRTPARRTSRAWCHVAGGLDAYRRLIRVHTSLDLDADELHQIGLDEIARIDAELAELAGRDDRHGEPAPRRWPSSAPTRRCTSRPATRSSTRRRRASPAPTRRSPTGSAGCPSAPCEVVRMGAHEEEHSTIAYYRQPAIDGSRPGQYFINTVAPGRRGRATRPRRSPTTSPSRATTSRSRSGRSCRTCRSSGATSGRRRSSRAGACTPSA